MKSSFNLFLLVLFINCKLFAQDKSNTRFGTVDQNELEMKCYKLDSTADAIVLYEQGIFHFDYNQSFGGYTIVSNYHIRIKILKKSGLGQATFTIPYIKDSYGNEETISDLQGFTFTIENGKTEITKLKAESIFDEHIYNRYYQRKISMPNVKEGSVFEYKYTKESPLKLKNKPDDWYFQNTIPVKWSELNITVPDYFLYKIILGGYFPLAENTNQRVIIKINGDPASFNLGGDNVEASSYRFVMKEIPAFKNEQFITTKNDYVSKVDFELSSVKWPNSPQKNFTMSWEDINKTLIESDYFGGKLKWTHYLKDLVDTLSTVNDSSERMNAAFRYVAENFKWNKVSSIYAREDLKKIFEKRKGNVSEINLLLVSLLRELGFDSSPVILSTRNNGKINETMPMLDNFNYVIAEVKFAGKDILMDATDPFSNPGILPERCLNGSGRLIKKEETRFISLTPAEKYTWFEIINATIDIGTGIIKGDYSLSCGGYAGLWMRTKIQEDGENEVIESIKKEKSDWQIENFKIENKENTLQSLKISYDFSFDNTGPSGGKIYLNPMLSGKISKNIFTAPERKYPIDYARTFDEIFVASIKIPEGYEVEEFPKSAIIKLPDSAGKHTYSVDVDENTIRISSRISIYKTYFTPDEYLYLREFYNNIIQKHSEQVVLKRK